ncbi:hypothetical protein VIGAN_UM156800, partial [Vigna angularis var. angularis]
QYAYGLQALGRQLHAMGLTDVPKVDPDSSIAAALMDMYQSMGMLLLSSMVVQQLTILCFRRGRESGKQQHNQESF